MLDNLRDWLPTLLTLIGAGLTLWARYKREKRADTKTVGQEDREDASLYAKFVGQVEGMEKRHKDEMAAMESRLDAKHAAEMRVVREQLARTRAALDYVLENVDPVLAKMARQIESGEFVKKDKE